MSEKKFIPVLPAEGFVDTKQIIGDKRNNIPGVIPISPSTFYAGLKTGRYKLKKVTDGGRSFYPVGGEDGVRALLKRIENDSEAAELTNVPMT